MARLSGRFAGLTLLVVIAGCGSGSEPGPGPGGGSNIGTAVIGPAGGELVTADSAFVLTIPPGALSTQTTISVTAEDPGDPNSYGKMYRLEPAGLAFSQPVTIQVGRDSASLRGAAPASFGLAFRDNADVLRANVTSEVVEPARSPSIRVPQAAVLNWYLALSGLWTNLPRYVVVQTFWQIRPDPAQVQAGRTVTLEILACMEEDDLNEAGPALRTQCAASIRRGTWRVRAAVGSSTNLGTVEVGTPSSTARYTAPSQRPEPPVVVVEATLLWEARGVSARLPVPVTILPAATSAGTMEWSWHGGDTRTQTSADGHYTFTETVSDNGGGNASFDALGGALGGYSWVLKIATYSRDYQNVVTTINVGPTCTVTRIETIRRVATEPGDPGNSNGWYAAIVPNQPTGSYVLQPGGGSFKIRETTSGLTRTRCPGAPDIDVPDPEVVRDDFDFVPLRFVTRPMPSPDAREFTGSDGYQKDEITAAGLQYVTDVAFSWDFLNP